MFNTKTIGEEGQKLSEVQATGVELRGFLNTLAAAEIATSAPVQGSGLLIVEDSTNNKGAVISMHNNAGTPVLTKLAGSADVGIAAEASDVNVYIVGGNITVQNNSNAEVTVSVKVYS